MATLKRLCEKSVTALGLIAEGHGYSHIVESHPDITYRDIFTAAEEALRMVSPRLINKVRMRQIKSRYPHAYKRWETSEDDILSSLFRNGRPIAQIARQLRRRPSAIRSRLRKLLLSG